MYELIKSMPSAMASVKSVLEHANIDISSMDEDTMIDTARKFSAPCHHKWDRPYKGHGTRKCTKCGGLQDN